VPAVCRQLAKPVTASPNLDAPLPFQTRILPTQPNNDPTLSTVATPRRHMLPLPRSRDQPTADWNMVHKVCEGHYGASTFLFLEQEAGVGKNGIRRAEMLI
jgi:hypothetical protein